MDPTSLYSQWLQQQQLLSEPTQHTQQVQHDARTPSALDDWAKERSTPTTQTGVGSPLPATTTLDMSDFTTLGDIGAPTTSTSSLSSPPQAFYASFQPSNYFITTPYNTIAYGTPWPSQSHLPLSNYSSLNGATTSSSGSSPTPSQQQQQQQQSSSQQMMIDPALTTMNSASSNGVQQQQQQQYTSMSNYSTQPSQQQQRPQYQYTQHLHPALSLNTSYGHPSHYLQSQQHPSPQGTLSPQALLSSSNSIVGPVSTSHFYSQTPSVASGSQGPSPQERKQQFQNAVRPLLQASAFTGAQAVSTLVDRIDEYGSQDVDGLSRLEILTKIRDGAGNHYFRAWSENPSAIDITREWLKAAFTAKSDSPLVETIMPLLHIIDRLPLTVESLKASKLGKIVVKLVKDPPSPAIKDMASNVERRWRQLISGADGAQKQPDNNMTEDSKSKKRKQTEAPISKAPPLLKKAAVGTTLSSRPLPLLVKREPKPAVTAVKDAKSDSSFFSAPKPKPKLPSFKKASLPSQVKKEHDPNVAQPSSIDPFQEALKSMAKARKESPVVSTPPSTSVSTPPHTGLAKNGKKKKSVTWVPDAQLESIRFIEKAIYDDDPVDGIHTSHSLRDLDRGEGAALHAHLFEETVDWSEPIPIEIPIDLRPRGEESEEKTTQEQREQTALGALYTPAHIPDTPAEPSSVMSEEEVDKDVKTMTSGPEVDAIFWSGGPAPSASHFPSVSDLVGQLAVGNMDPALGGASFNGQGLDLKAVGLDANATLSAVQALPQEQLQQLLRQLTTPAMYGQAEYGGDQAWSASNQFSSEYGQGYQNDDHWAGGRGRGLGRGRGRGGRVDDGGYRHNKRKPCSFFAAGRCKYGDQCDFAHEISS